MPSITTNAGSAGSNNTNVTSTGSDGAPGTGTWTNAGNYAGSSGTATSSLGSSPVTTESLDAYDFDPGLAGGSTVSGMSFQVTVSKLNNNRGIEFYGRTLFVGGSSGTPQSGTDFVGTALTTTSAGYTVGSSTDLWGFSSGTLSVSNMNSATEGTGPTLSTWWSQTGGVSAGTVEAKSVALTVTYSTGGGGGGSNNQNLTLLGCSQAERPARVIVA
jgi:hypothetical protein